MGTVAETLVPGEPACCYVATTTQLSRTVGALRGARWVRRAHLLGEPGSRLHVQGLAVRLEHRLVERTGFLVTTRRACQQIVWLKEEVDRLASYRVCRGREFVPISRQVRDAIELPQLHADLFKETSSSRHASGSRVCDLRLSARDLG